MLRAAFKKNRYFIVNLFDKSTLYKYCFYALTHSHNFKCRWLSLLHWTLIPEEPVIFFADVYGCREEHYLCIWWPCINEVELYTLWPFTRITWRVSQRFTVSVSLRHLLYGAWYIYNIAPDNVGTNNIHPTYRNQSYSWLSCERKSLNQTAFFSSRAFINLKIVGTDTLTLFMK